MNNPILDITQKIGFLNGQLAYIEALFGFTDTETGLR